MINSNTKFYPDLIGIPSNYSKRLYLQELCNKYGNFVVASSWKDEQDNNIFSKHRNVLSCWELNSYYLDLATHRSPLPLEVFLDIDDDISEVNFHRICMYLKKEYGFVYRGYSSGGKGWHIHVFIPELIYKEIKSSKLKEVLRETLISKFNCDLMKKSDKMLIALEGCPHFRTGKPKTLVNSWGRFL